MVDGASVLVVAGGLLSGGEVTAATAFLDLGDLGGGGGCNSEGPSLPAPVYEAAAFTSSEGSPLVCGGAEDVEGDEPIADCFQLTDGEWETSADSLQVKKKSPKSIPNQYWHH